MRRSIRCPSNSNWPGPTCRSSTPTGQLTLNLRQRGLFPSTHENIRIIDLRTRGATAHPVGGSIGSFALMYLDFEHRGISRITSGGQTLPLPALPDRTP